MTRVYPGRKIQLLVRLYFFLCRTTFDLGIACLDFSYFGGADSLSEGRSPRRTSVESPTKVDDGKSYPGPPQDPSDFLWLLTEEPHRSRRTAIMKAHPEVSSLLTLAPKQHAKVLASSMLSLGCETNGS